MCSNVCNKYEKAEKILKYHMFFKKTLSLSFVYSKCDHKYEKVPKGEELIEILKVVCLITNIEEYRIYITTSEKNISQ